MATQKTYPTQRRWPGLLEGHVRTVAAVLVFGLCINLLMLAAPLYMLQVYDRVLASRSVETLALLTGIALVALAALSVLDGIRMQLLSRAATRLEAMVTPRVLRLAVERGGIGPDIGRGTGDRRAAADPDDEAAAPRHAQRDVRAIASLLSGSGAVALLDIPWCPVFVVLIALFHPAMGLLAAAGVVMLLFLAWLDDRTGRAPREQASRASRRSSELADDGLRHADVIRAMGMASAWQSRLELGGALAVDASLAVGRRSSRIVAASKFVRQALQVAMLGLGAVLVVRQHVSPGVMIAATVLLGRALAPIEHTIAGWRQLAQARGAVRRLGAFLAGRAPAEHMPLPVPEGKVALEGAGVAVDDDTCLLSNVSLTIDAGRQLGVIGPSGAGKSTLGRVLVGLVPLTSGHVRLDGADLAQWDPQALGEHIGWLPQDVQLLEGTVAENIARLRSPQDEHARIVEAATLAGAHDTIVRLPKGYETRVGGAQGIALSAGQRQQIGLARALFGSPKLVVLDEPNANLDGAAEARLVATLGALRERGATVVVITHRPAILRHADRVLVLQAGRIAVLGDRDEVLDKFAKVTQLRPAALAAGANP